ncbi:MAG TPA: hypothetical protein PKK96_00735 [Anaerolineales bacterium]|nr:hypothetical protein [Anaerolineales bacterium]HMR97864.1 hypothetical protein [Anaerolineales bacterium]HNQ94216.1 hypothetical protein [Anaerolineales bacterium]HNS59499.1 hypothetical protein [Anaerolineales bacterium]
MKKLFLLSSFLFLLVSCSPAPTAATPLPPSGAVLFQDEFESNASGWDRLANDGGIMDYDGGGYRMLIRQPQLNFWSTPELNLRDARVETDVTKLGGPAENRAGVMCRYQNGDYYFFIISNDGYYAIGKFVGGQTTLLGQNEMQASELIQADTVNHLRADCIGDSLVFYVNYQLIAGASDTELAAGDVGLLAGSFTQPGVDVLFDNFVVIQP